MADTSGLTRKRISASRPSDCAVLARCSSSSLESTDILTPADYLDLHRELLAECGWLIDPTARVAADAVLEGWGCIGAGARVGAGAQLRDAVVWDSAVVPAHTVCTGGILTGNPLVDSGARPRGTDG